MSTKNTEQNNPFEELANSHVPPEELKDEVMSSAHISYVIIFTLDLFINKPMALLASLFKTEE